MSGYNLTPEQRRDAIEQAERLIAEIQARRAMLAARRVGADRKGAR